MSTGDLERRALAAAAERQAALEASEEARRREQAEREAERDRFLIDLGIRELGEILGHRTSPADWEIVSYEVNEDYGITRTVVFARTVLLGVEIRTGNLSVGGQNRWTLYVMGMRGPLTLENFGQALAERKQREQQR